MQCSALICCHGKAGEKPIITFYNSSLFNNILTYQIVNTFCYSSHQSIQFSLNYTPSSSSSFCGAGGIPPSALQPFKDYCANPALVPLFISKGAP
jgi:hypothetical protein